MEETVEKIETKIDGFISKLEDLNYKLESDINDSIDDLKQKIEIEISNLESNFNSEDLNDIKRGVQDINDNLNMAIIPALRKIKEDITNTSFKAIDLKHALKFKLLEIQSNMEYKSLVEMNARVNILSIVMFVLLVLLFIKLN